MDETTHSPGLDPLRPGHRALVVGGEVHTWQDLIDGGPVEGPRVLSARRELGTVRAIVGALVQGVPLVPLHPRWTEPERAAFLARLEGATLPPGTAWVVPTSGSTGAARGVVLSFRAVRASAEAVRTHLSLGPDDVWGLTLPLAHVGGLSVLSRALVTGASVVLVPEGPFDAGALAAEVRTRGITHLPLVPAQLAALLEAGLTGTGTLRWVLVGGAACPPALVERARAAGLPVALTWGMSELASQVATGPATLEATPPGVVGAPLPGVELRVDAEGVLRVRAPMAFDGYVGEPGSGPDAEGWVTTGDVGALTDTGQVQVQVLGRRDSLIVTGGENVHPEAVEAVLLSHPGVDEACVVGCPDARWGAVVVAVIAGPALPDDAALTAYVALRLANHRRPRRWVRMDALPRTAGGKTDRTRCRALACAAPDG